MTLEAYFAQYGEAYRWSLDPNVKATSGKKNVPPSRPPRRALLEIGMLLFDEASAPSWGGPYPGNFAHFRLWDHRADVETLTRMTAYVVACQAAFDERGSEAILGHRKPRHLKLKTDDQTKVKETADERRARIRADYVFRLENESPTLARPFTLDLSGNDDTSYRRTFADEVEAREFLALLEASQPLNLWTDIHPLFAFTN